MPKRVSGTPNRQPRKPRRRAPAASSTPSMPLAEKARPVETERPKAATSTRSESAVARPGPRVRAQAAPVVDYHYVIEDLRRVGVLALAMFVVLGVLAVLLH